MRCSWFANNTDEYPFVLYGNDELMRRMDAYRQSPGGEIWTQGIDWKELKEYETAVIEGYQVIPTIAKHEPKEKCYNYIVKKDGKALFYGHDSALFPEDVWEHFTGCHFDFVSLDCTMLFKPFGATHMNIDQCCQVRERMLDTGCADRETIFCINHFSHNGAADEYDNLWLHEELATYMNEKGFLVSCDGMTVEF